jgi:hypothetical protein
MERVLSLDPPIRERSGKRHHTFHIKPWLDQYRFSLYEQ